MKSEDSAHELRVLRFLAAIVGVCHQWARGEIVQVPSPSIEGRTDIIVIIFPRADLEVWVDGDTVTDTYHPAGMIVRNAGRYSARKSMALAKKLSALFGELAPHEPGALRAYDDDDGMIGETDPEATWVDLVEHTTATHKLRRLESGDKPPVTRRSRKKSK